MRIKYFCKEKIELASTFTETDKSGVQFDDLNEYFIKTLESRDKGYFEEFIKTYDPVLQNRANRFVLYYGLNENDAEDIKQIFLETLWFVFLDYDTSDPIPLLQYTMMRKNSTVLSRMSLLKIRLYLCSKRLGGIFAMSIFVRLPITFHLRTNKLYHYPSEFDLTASVFSNRAPMQRLL